MKRLIPYSLILIALLSILSACSSNPPKQTHNNICHIYNYDDDWEDAAQHSAKRWGVPEYILMAFIYQESRFRHDAQPQRDYALGIIPLPRSSSAYGYCQAQDPAWFDYKQATGNLHAKRTSLDDSLDFIGWYNYQSHKRNGIKRTDAYNLYLAYHEGQGGYSRKSYRHKKWLLHVAQKVKNRATLYEKQLKRCHKLQYLPSTKPKSAPSHQKKNTGVCKAPWPYC